MLPPGPLTRHRRRSLRRRAALTKAPRLRSLAAHGQPDQPPPFTRSWDSTNRASRPRPARIQRPGLARRSAPRIRISLPSGPLARRHRRAAASLPRYSVAPPPPNLCPALPQLHPRGPLFGVRCFRGRSRPLGRRRPRRLSLLVQSSIAEVSPRGWPVNRDGLRTARASRPPRARCLWPQTSGTSKHTSGRHLTYFQGGTT